MAIRKALLNGSLGYGTAPLGNMFRQVPDKEAIDTVQAAWDAGVRYYDTAPFYGAGLAEIRLGQVLSDKPRNSYRLSTKVGRIILDEVADQDSDNGSLGEIFKYGRKNKIQLDYTEKGTMKSFEDSLKRLGVDRIDFLWIHDISRDFHGDAWVQYYAEARKGAMVALTKLRSQGVINGWGIGVNRVEPCEITLEMTDVHPDAFLLAGRYTILDHERALTQLMPGCAAKGVDIIVGGPYSSGVLAGGSHFEYGPIPASIEEKRNKLAALCKKYSLPIKAAALHFSLAHPATAAIIPGATNPEHVLEDQRAFNTTIPDEFWYELRAQELVSVRAPLPIDGK